MISTRQLLRLCPFKRFSIMQKCMKSVVGENINFVSIQRALLSVSNKEGLIPLAQTLAAYGVELLSTGGTAKTLRDAGVAVKDISEFTCSPEILDGRVKTLHPKVHGALLGVRGNQKHVHEMEENRIEKIDMVVVNLYPFETTGEKIYFDHSVSTISHIFYSCVWC